MNVKSLGEDRPFGPHLAQDKPPVPIAIVGLACRLPGQASTPDDFWKLCARGRNAWSEMPRSRFNQAAFHHPDPQRTGAFNPQGGHFLDDPARFDAPFFNITLEEARSLDPQQRLSLECTYEALENAGIPKQSLSGRNVGVFAGASFSDYDVRNLRDLDTVPMHEITGNALSLQSNRISYYFDLRGPSFTIDTACSSSLTALHLACQSLRAGESSAAIVSGAHLNLTPDIFVSMSLASLFSDSGRSYAFDHKASGFGRGEAVGCLILKPLDAALADGDHIRAMIANSGINQDGRTRGITMPNSDAQEALIRSVYKSARLDPAETGYVEAHGTGTQAGDPLEAAALHRVFGHDRSPKEPLFVGSVKTNVGHAEGASGIVSVIKTVLMLERGFVLPNSGFEKANKAIPLDEWNLKVPRKLVPWPRGKRFASINNFGFGGGNAHVVLEKKPAVQDSEGNKEPPEALKRKVITLSGHDERAVREQARSLGFYLERRPEAFEINLLNNVAYTVGQRRTVFPWRLAISGSSAAEAMRQLAADSKPSRVSRSSAVGFVFTGQGAQWHAMGRELLPAYPVFRQTMEAIDDYLASLGAKFSIIHEIQCHDATSSSISKAYMSQPACTAIQLALTDLLRSWGILPSAVTGHSSGEIAAAYAAGILTLEECVRVAYARGAAAALLATDIDKPKGAMMAVGASSAEVQPYLDGLQGHRAVIACINSESNVTVSGDDTAVTEIQSMLENNGTFARKLQVDVGYHSHHMQRVSQQYRTWIDEVQPQNSSVPFHSTVHGRAIPPSELTASYWVDNLVSRVEFVLGLRSLLEQGGETEISISSVLEIGPHSALQSPIKQVISHHFPGLKVQYVPSLRRKVDAVEAMQQLSIALWLQGVPLDLEAVNFPDVRAGCQSKPTLLADLPSYPWNHSETYWHTARLSDNVYHRPFPQNDILGSLSMENIDFEPRWRNIISVDDYPWIRQHRVHGTSVFPLAGFLAMAVEAVSQQAALHNTILKQIELRDISINRALSVPESTSIEIMLSMRPYKWASGKSTDLWHEFHIFSWTEGRGWDEHCHGLIHGIESKEPNPVDGGRQQAMQAAELSQRAAMKQAACKIPVDSDVLYENMAKCGVDYGPLFRKMTGITVSKNNEAMARVVIPDTKSTMPQQHETPCIIHPVVLDLCLHLTWVLLGYSTSGSTNVTHLPCFIGRVALYPSLGLQPGSELQLYGNSVRSLSTRTPASSQFMMTRLGDPTNPLVEIEGTVIVPLSHDDCTSSAAEPLCYKEQLEPCLDFLSEADTDLLSAPEPSDGPGAHRSHLLNQAAYMYLCNTVNDVRESEVSSFKPHHQRLFRWAQEICGSTSSGTTPYYADHGCDSAQAKELIHYVRGMNADGELTCKLGECLTQVLRGDAEPLAVMLEDDLLSRHYQDNDNLHQSYGRITKCIDKMAHQNPHLNILEVGAGTGGFTLPILQTLGGEAGSMPRFGHFTFTDISPGFFNKARTKLHHWDHLMSYQSLDISSNPVPQGFEPHSYDVIFACNVLHATPRIRQTLGNVRRMLKPGGKLLLIEETNLQPHHLKYAVLPGWWLSEDPERFNGPVLDRELWQQVLKESDFAGLDLFIDDYPGALQRSNSFIVATAKNVLSSKDQDDVVVVSPRKPYHGLADTLVSGLKALSGKHATAGDILTADMTGKLCVFLDTPNAPLLSALTPDQFQAFQKLLTGASGVLWVVQKGNAGLESLDAHLAIGLVRSIRSETSLPLATLDVGEAGSLSDEQLMEKICRVFNSLFCNHSVLQNGDMDFVLQQGRICVPRVVKDSILSEILHQNTVQAVPQLQPVHQLSRPLKMVPKNEGGLDDCFFTDNDVFQFPLSGNDVEMQVVCVGLNFRDVLVAMRQIPGGQLGQECSGIITAVGASVKGFQVGDRVCATAAGSMATQIRCPAPNVWKVPDTMTFEVAASVPVVFATVYYSLVDVGRLAPDETILIHAAAGGVGQAAIMLAHEIGAKVFATVSSEEKKQFLMDKYQIPKEHIFFSRDTSFARGINKATGGQGVDVVLNSLTGDALRATFETLAPFGRFVELGKRDIVQNAQLEMAHFDYNVSFSSVDLTLIIKKRPALLQRLLREAFRLVSQPAVQSRWSTVNFSISEIETAFRALQGGRATGKAIIRMQNDDMVKVKPARKLENTLSPDASYIVTGGTRGIGLDIAHWLPSNGARHLILISRSGAKTEISCKVVQELKKAGVKVEVCQCNLGDAGDVEQTLTPVLQRMPPVRGVVHGAMVLRDVLFEKMTLEDYNTVIRPRVNGILNLQDTLQGQQRLDLDFWINLSSVSGLVGLMGQAAYASSCTFMGAMAQYPTLPGISCRTIDLPRVRDAGYLAADKGRMQEAGHQTGGASVDTSEIHAVLAAAIRNELKDTCNNHCLFGLHAMEKTPPAELPFWAHDPKMSHFLRHSILAETETSQLHQTVTEVSPASAVRHASDRAEAEASIVRALMQRMASTLMRSVDEMDAFAPISAYGLDSLVTIEIRNWITRELETSFQILDILTSDSIHALAQKILNRTTLIPPRVRVEWEKEEPSKAV